jgi:tetratricopeptide (TPR) repeat protein
MEGTKGWVPKLAILSALMIMPFFPAISQENSGTDYSSVEASKYCGDNLSSYREFFKKDLYGYAREPWVNVFRDCPGSSERMYVDGVTMYRSFIEKSPDGPAREGLIDTLMLIYDRRIEYFGGEGNVLGRKGRDLLTYRGEDIEQVRNAYQILKRSVELMGKESQETVMVLLISSGTSLKREGIIDENQFIEDYVTVIGILDEKDPGSSPAERTRSAIDEILQKEDVQICEELNRFYDPQIERNRSDTTFLKKVILNFKTTGCDRSEVYLKALENLYDIEPGPESAHNLAILFITRNDLVKAAGFMEEAVKGENTDRETRAEWYYELAVVTQALGDPCKAIGAARESIKLKRNYGKAYILLGDAFIASIDDKLGDDFQQRAAFWAAADMYKIAASSDPAVKEEAEQILASCLGQFPSQEDVFFHDIKEGDSFRVGGCINENTTVRARTQ